jgi:chromosome segregation ATPase
MPPEDFQKLQENIVEMKLDIREIKTLLGERDVQVKDNSANIGRVVKDVEKIRNDVFHVSEETHKNTDHLSILESQLSSKLERVSEQIDKLREASEKRSKDLELSLHAMSETKFQVKLMWGVFTAAILGIVGAIVKLFTR